MKMSKLFSEWVGCSPVCPDLSISWKQKMILRMAVILREVNPKHPGKSHSVKLDILCAPIYWYHSCDKCDVLAA